MGSCICILIIYAVWWSPPVPPTTPKFLMNNPWSEWWTHVVWVHCWTRTWKDIDFTFNFFFNRFFSGLGLPKDYVRWFTYFLLKIVWKSSREFFNFLSLMKVWVNTSVIIGLWFRFTPECVFPLMFRNKNYLCQLFYKLFCKSLN